MMICCYLFKKLLTLRVTHSMVLIDFHLPLTIHMVSLAASTFTFVQILCIFCGDYSRLCHMSMDLQRRSFVDYWYDETFQVK